MMRLRTGSGHRRGFRNAERTSPSVDNQPVKDDAEEHLAESSDDDLKETSDRDHRRSRSLRARSWNPFKRFTRREQQALPLFGIELTQAVEISRLDDNLDVPSIVRRCVAYVTEHGLEQQGVYRLSGRKKEMERLKQLFNEQGDVDLAIELPNGGSDDVNTAASLLKLYFRELPSPMLTDQLIEDFTKVAHGSQDLQQLQQLLNSIPQPHYMTLGWVVKHLVEVIRNANVNKMSIDNIMIVFIPTLNINRNLLELMLTEPDKCFPHVHVTHQVDPNAVLRLSPCKIPQHNRKQSMSPRSSSPRSFSPRSFRRRKHKSALNVPPLPSQDQVEAADAIGSLDQIREMIQTYEQHLRHQTQQEYQSSPDAESAAFAPSTIWTELRHETQQATRTKRLHRHKSLDVLQRTQSSDFLEDRQNDTTCNEAAKENITTASLVAHMEKVCRHLIMENGKLASLNQLRTEELKDRRHEVSALADALNQPKVEPLTPEQSAVAIHTKADTASRLSFSDSDVEMVERRVADLFEEQAVLKELNNSLMMDLAYETEQCVALEAQLA
eukprot:TRINITY_DN9706_c0_g1_i1.p1 TRINITY_DN9706_c0_g1~~TRINITY_DN9706_c0_g1_i1.p1  ORF type:complete len:554 (+),score=124.09 TRINITY_DN9706_c0_g1_i1:110-1771(+)